MLHADLLQHCAPSVTGLWHGIGRYEQADSALLVEQEIGWYLGNFLCLARPFRVRPKCSCMGLAQRRQASA
ncbi:hypothetical protein C1889_17550 [Pseudomonas sp. FW507-12TSA]|nr:hypothetical protein C1889_17550 [Pseudomonas sp. FW507-12TSA]